MNDITTKYPIIEALCEFQFVPSQPWDMTMPGLFYNIISKDFPIKEQKAGIGIGISPQKGLVEQKLEISQRIQFWREDRSALVQIGPNILAINKLKPYASWEDFKPLILANLNNYISIVKPEAFKRVSLRYINHIVIDDTKFALNEYFKFYPFIPDRLPSVHGPFNIQVDFPLEGGKEFLKIILTSIPPQKPDSSYFVLDLNYELTEAMDIPLDRASDWIEKAKETLNSTFKACITEKYERTLLGT